MTQALAEFGEAAQVLEVVKSVLRSIHNIGRMEARVETLAGMARALQHIGLIDSAPSILRQAVEMVETLPPAMKARALSDVAVGLAQAGDAAAAADLMKRAVTAANAVVQRVNRAMALAWLVLPLVRTGDREAAAQVAEQALAAAESVAGERDKAFALSVAAERSPGRDKSSGRWTSPERSTASANGPRL